ncbi:hypothetical protein V5O48_002262 [Marasmius crinis-equi]|uniref:Uncharacterized protein n=1 Tax=Marasmius crinis-equi TaxID=585013 RepID=A0ABR3FXA8_9AGAR
MASTLALFGCLDELVQVIYQGINRFVLLSNVDDEQWTCKLGLAGEGKWWSGSWKESDIHAIVGSKASETILEKFGQKLAESIIHGDMFISGYTPSSDASIKLTLSPGSKKPMHMPLEEIPAEEAAAFASEVFLEIALRAQSRQCQLHGSAYAAPSKVAPVSTFTTKAGSSSRHKDKTVVSEDEDDPKPATAVKRSGESSKRKVQELSPDPEPKSKANKPAPRPIKGASLANPNKKARKYQAIEFGSDED